MPITYRQADVVAGRIIQRYEIPNTIRESRLTSTRGRTDALMCAQDIGLSDYVWAQLQEVDGSPTTMSTKKRSFVCPPSTAVSRANTRTLVGLGIWRLYVCVYVSDVSARQMRGDRTAVCSVCLRFRTVFPAGIALRVSACTISLCRLRSPFWTYARPHKSANQQQHTHKLLSVGYTTHTHSGPRKE